MPRENSAVECPFRRCGETVKLKRFRQHAINTQHSKMIPDLIAFKIPSDERDIEKHEWRMGAVSAFNLSFHLNLGYYKPSKCFVFSVWLGTSKDRAEKYRACIRIGDKTDGDNELSFYGVRVTSIENIPSFYRCMEKNVKHFLCIPRILIKNLCENSEGSDGNKLIVQLKISET